MCWSSTDSRLCSNNFTTAEAGWLRCSSDSGFDRQPGGLGRQPCFPVGDREQFDTSSVRGHAPEGAMHGRMLVC
mgnify:CR=1 FL=1